MSHTQKWKVSCSKLRRVQEAAQANKQEQFTSLAHHLTVEALKIGGQFTFFPGEAEAREKVKLSPYFH